MKRAIASLSIAIAAAWVTPTSGAAATIQVSAVKCPGSVRLLDYFEGESLRGYRYSPSPSDASALQGVLASIRNRMPDRAALIAQQSGPFASHLQSVAPGSLGATPDSDRITHPAPGCEFRIFLRDDSTSGIQIDPVLWNALSPTDRAGAMVHWALTQEAISGGELLPGSIYIRVLNSVLPLRQFQELPLADLIDLTRKAQLPSLRIQGVLINLSRELQLNPTGNLLSGTPIAGSEWIHPSGQKAHLKADPVAFYPEGALRKLRFEGELNLPMGQSTVPFATPDRFANSPYPQELNPSLYLFPNGQVERGITLRPVELETPVARLRLAQGHGRAERTDNSLLVFYPHGELRLATQASGTIRWMDNWVPISPASSISLQSPTQFMEFVLAGQIPLSIQDRIIEFSGHLLFHASGALSCGFPVRSGTLTNIRGKTVRYDAGEQLCLDPTGKALLF